MDHSGKFPWVIPEHSTDCSGKFHRSFWKVPRIIPEISWDHPRTFHASFQNVPQIILESSMDRSGNFHGSFRNVPRIPPESPTPRSPSRTPTVTAPGHDDAGGRFLFKMASTRAVFGLNVGRPRTGRFRGGTPAAPEPAGKGPVCEQERLVVSLRLGRVTPSADCPERVKMVQRGRCNEATPRIQGTVSSRTRPFCDRETLLRVFDRAAGPARGLHTHTGVKSVTWNREYLF